jgi:hypothetical protein
MLQVFTPVNTVKIMDTMNTLKEALCELTARNADLARRNNQLTIEYIDLLDETSDLTHLMSTVSNVYDVTEVDMNDNGNNADGAGGNPPNNAQDISIGEDAVKRKRNHDHIVHVGHRVHPS